MGGNEERRSHGGSLRPQRQRIARGEKIVPRQHGYQRNGEQRPYGNNRNGYGRNDDYYPSYHREERPSRPQYSRAYGDAPHAEGEYTPRYPNREGGYQPRPRHNHERPSYGNGGGYSRNQEGGYQSRGGYSKPGYSKGGYHKGGSRNGFDRPNRPYRQRTADYDPSAKYNVQKVLRFKEENFDPEAPIRLNRYLANAGVCSRREADIHIAAGLITVNGEVVTELGHKVLRTDVVTFKGETVSLEDKIYLLLNKPKDYVTTADDPEGRKTVMDLVKGACPERIYPVGRLDRNTTGVLLFTNDGEMAAKMMHPQYMKKKIYHVYCNKSVSFADMQKILSGIQLEDGEIKADSVEYASEVDRKQIGIEIHSGKNRIVRRIFESLGYRVVKLDRVYFAGLTKKNLRRGQWRFLTEAEVNILRMGAYE